VAADRISVADLVAFVLLLFLLVQPLASGISAYSAVQTGLGALARIEEVLALPEETAGDRRAPVALDGRPVEIAFRSVRFEYPEDGTPTGRGAPVLRDVSFTAPAGRRTALVGPSGAGKSTVLALLERFYDVTGGSVCVGGADVRELDREQLRARMAYVEQDAPALAGSLRDNLLLGAPGASQADLLQVLDRVNLGELVERSRDGLDAQVGDDGILLSGGQRQRLAIARALLARPAVLLLDEPTASLDARNEQALADAVAAIGPSTTVLVVAHRLSTVVDADRIVVLDDGGSSRRARTTSSSRPPRCTATWPRGSCWSERRVRRPGEPVVDLRVEALEQRRHLGPAQHLRHPRGAVGQRARRRRPAGQRRRREALPHEGHRGRGQPAGARQPVGQPGGEQPQVHAPDRLVDRRAERARLVGGPGRARQRPRSRRRSTARASRTTRATSFGTPRTAPNSAVYLRTGKRSSLPGTVSRRPRRPVRVPSGSAHSGSARSGDQRRSWALSVRTTAVWAARRRTTSSSRGTGRNRAAPAAMPHSAHCVSRDGLGHAASSSSASASVSRATSASSWTSVDEPTSSSDPSSARAASPAFSSSSSAMRASIVCAAMMRQAVTACPGRCGGRGRWPASARRRSS
jgi:ABC-type multidrug transport system ATPase subunit